MDDRGFRPLISLPPAYNVVLLNHYKLEHTHGVGTYGI